MTNGINFFPQPVNNDDRTYDNISKQQTLYSDLKLKQQIDITGNLEEAETIRVLQVYCVLI